MAKVIYVDMDKEARKKQKKFEREQKCEQAKEWIREHGADALKVTIAGAVVLVPIGLSIAGHVNRARVNRRLEKVERDKELHVYDRSLGCYLRLKHKLSSDELATISKRKQNGERLVDILNDLKLLK